MSKHTYFFLILLYVLVCTIHQSLITTFLVGIFLVSFLLYFYKGSGSYLLPVIIIARLVIFQHGATLNFAHLGCGHSGQEIDIAISGKLLKTKKNKPLMVGSFGSLLFDTYLSPDQSMFIGGEKNISIVGRVVCLGPGILHPFTYDSFLFSQGIRGVITKIHSFDNIPPDSEHNVGLYAQIQSFLPKHNNTTTRIPKPSTIPQINTPTHPLIQGVLWGDTSGLPKTTYRNFIDSGLVHLISASGGNIMLVILLSIYGFFFIPIRYRKYIQLILVLFYAYGVGENISFLRALIAYLCINICLPPGCRPHKSLVIMLSICIIILYNPSLIVSSWGLVLSVAGVFGLTFAPQLSSLQHKPILSQLSSSILATYALIGPLLLLTGKINIISPLLTVVASPLIIAMLVSYFIFVLCGYGLPLDITISLLERLAHRGATSGYFLIVSLPKSILFLGRIGTRIFLVIIYYRARKHYFAYDTRD